MRRYLILLIFILAFCFAPIAEARKLALLIGVDDYETVQSLECCVNDMKTIKEALLKIGFEEDDIQMLYTGGLFKYLPTKKKIEKSISAILLKAKPSDTVFIAFSGHGAQEGNVVYFCPPDVDMDNLSGTAVSITKVMDLFANNCKAKFKWMVVDACRYDPSQGTKGIGVKEQQIDPVPPEGIALFQSCAKGEVSWEDSDSGNGFFTKNFAAALSGEADANRDGKLTLMEVCTWTTTQTKEQVKKSRNENQRPYLSGSVSDFTLVENLNLLKARALAQEAQKAMKEKDYKRAYEYYKQALELYSDNEEWKEKLELARRFFITSPPEFNPMDITVPNDFMTIEEAYKNVKDGGVITIKPGKYELSATIVVDRPVTFQGSVQRANDVVISCSSSHTFQIESDSPLFQFLTVNNGAENKATDEGDAENCDAFSIVGGAPKLYQCVIASNNGNGIHVTGVKANPQVESCIVKDCGANGMFVEKGGLGKFVDCDIYKNVRMGIEVKSSANPTVSHCKIHDGKASGIAVLDKALGSFNNCEVYGNDDQGIGVGFSGNPTIIGCKFHGGKSAGASVFDGGLGSFKDCEFYENELSGIIVDTSGNPTFEKCLMHNNTQGGAFVVNKGLGKFNNCEFYENGYAGIQIIESGNPTVSSCKFYDGKQSGIDIFNKGLGSFFDCEIYGNQLAGVGIQSAGNPTLTRCKIHDGKSLGVSVTEGGLGKFISCEIYKNEFTGMSIVLSGNPVVNGCNIHHNKYGGIFVFNQGMGTFNNNSIRENINLVYAKYYNGVIGSSSLRSVKGNGNNPPIGSWEIINEED